MKGPVPATEQSNSGDLERQESVGCFTYIGLTSRKIPLFPSISDAEPATLSHQELCISHGTNCQFQPAWAAGLLQGNLVSRGARQTARAAPAAPWGKQQGAQPGTPGRQSQLPEILQRTSWEGAAGSEHMAGGKCGEWEREHCTGTNTAFLCPLHGLGLLRGTSYVRAFLKLSRSCPPWQQMCNLSWTWAVVCSGDPQTGT